MVAILIFSAGLIIAVLVSDLASRSILSTAVLFVAMGLALGSAGAGWFELDASSPEIAQFMEIALFTVLFTDGMQIRKKDLRQGGGLRAGPLRSACR